MNFSLSLEIICHDLYCRYGASCQNTTKTKRTADSFSIKNCIICQGGSDSVLRQSSTRGIESLKSALATRISFKCDKFLDAIDRLQSEGLHLENVVWHKDCFSTFTSKSHLDRLKRRSVKATLTHDNLQSATESLSCQLGHRSVCAMQWDKCLFCQDDMGGTLRQVMTLEMSAKVLAGAERDPTLSYRLAGITDLVAAEMKYHLKCYVVFCRKVEKLNEHTPDQSDQDALFDESCFHEVVKELGVELEAGNIFYVSSVWDRYWELCSSRVAETKFPQKGSSNNLRAFRQRLKEHFRDEIEFVIGQRKKRLSLDPTELHKTICCQ